ncbi:MAG: DUF192 domain-containing protein [Planctomycetes bacterium]|nr:DUF192 domain-containing protein [Planctomycetota bacterium]
MRLLKFAPVLLLLLALTACGDKTEDVEPMAWPFLETPTALSINGQSFSAFVAKTEAHRKRALYGLAIKEKQAIAYLYPKLDEAAEIKFRNLPDAADLVFIDAKGKAIAIESVPAFSTGTFPHAYAHEGARLVLQLPKGTAESLKISRGSDVKTEPDLLQEAEKAELQLARMYFVKTAREEEKPKDAAYVSLKVLAKADECAQGLKNRPELKDGEGVILPVSGMHEFWLKGVEGKCCAAYVERSQTGGYVISAMYEGIEDTGSGDLSRPLYYSPGTATYLAIWRGADFFTKNSIERRSHVVLAGVEVYSAENPDYAALAVKFGDTQLTCRLARNPSERETALIDAPSLKEGKGIVMAWDEPGDVKIESAPAGANLWFINDDGGNKYSIGEKVKGTGTEVKLAAKSRFVLAVPAGFEGKGDLDLPWLVRDLKPWLPAIAFYNSKQKDVVKDRWPTAKDNLRKLAHVELAITDSEQRRGLMFRTSLKTDHGMLFIYKEEEASLSYWMKNCKMNISIAFVNDRGEIIKIHAHMLAPKPGTPDELLENYPSGGPAKYAIEMDEDWFAKNGIKEGDRVFIPPEWTSLK